MNDDLAQWMACMRRGDFEAAWEISDRIRPAPALRDQRVLIRCDHGLGDTLQFIRYLPLVQRIARDVVVQLQPALRPLLQVKSEGAHDIEIEVMDLPHAFRTTLDMIPPPAALNVSAHTLGDGFHIGVAWQGGGWNAERDAPFTLVEALATLPRVTLHSLQEEDAGDLVQTARLMRALDLVISVDSMPAHLAGTLGVPVWTLLPADCDWRWMDGRDDSPWYPSMRLFRQRTRGNWDEVIARLLRDVPEESSQTTGSAARRA